jgi:integral membrane protein
VTGPAERARTGVGTAEAGAAEAGAAAAEAAGTEAPGTAGPRAPGRPAGRGSLVNRARSGTSVRAALLRYRVIAYVVGVGLIVLVLIGVPLRYAAHFPAVVEVVGPLHGFLYIVYLLCTADLAVRTRMHPLKTLLVMAAGTIPFLSFVAERRITRDVRARTG